MTPIDAQEIYHKGCKEEYAKHVADYSPVNQSKVVLAGFQAVIDAVTREVDNEYAMKLIGQTYDFTGQRGPRDAAVQGDATPAR